jgi:hypothetical protein
MSGSPRSQTPAEGIEAVNHPRRPFSGRRHSFSGTSVADYRLLYPFSALGLATRVEGGITTVESEKRSSSSSHVLGDFILKDHTWSSGTSPSPSPFLPPTESRQGCPPSTAERPNSPGLAAAPHLGVAESAYGSPLKQADCGVYAAFHPLDTPYMRRRGICKFFDVQKVSRILLPLLKLS